MEAKTRDLWVYIETTEFGEPRDVGLELLSPGRRLADKREGQLVAVVIGYKTDASIEAARVYGADKIIVVDKEEYREYSTEAYTNAMATLVKKYAPETLIIGATANGKDFAPRLAYRVDTGLTANATVLEINEDGNVEWIMPAFSGNTMATIICPDARPQIGTVRSGLFKKPELVDREVEIIREDICFPVEKIRTETLEILAAADEIVDLEGAEIVVAIGRGMGSPENVELAKELANVLGATLGATRAAVDVGWIGLQHQIGHSGKSIAPKLYIGCGISGAIQHVAGITDSEVIVAINTDSEAPIFNVADYGVVGDVAEVLPALIEEIRKAKA